MMHVLLAKSFGFSKIFCMDLNDFRLDFVKKFNVTSIRSDDPKLAEKIHDETSIGVDVAIVATSSLHAFQDALKLVRKGGTVVMFGVPSKGATTEIDMSLVYSKEISIVTTYAASDHDTKEALELISSGNVDVKSLITHKYSLEESQKAFEHAKTGDNAMKIIIEN
jgi:L-iditol 2-dehydrogenase